MKAILRTKCRCERELPYVSEGTQRVYIPIPLDPPPLRSDESISLAPRVRSREFEFQGERRDGVPVFVETDR